MTPDELTGKTTKSQHESLSINLCVRLAAGRCNRWCPGNPRIAVAREYPHLYPPDYSGTGLLGGHNRRGRTLRRMASEFSARDQALRKLQLPYALALRLRDAGVAPEVDCEYLDVEQDCLAGIYRMAEAKLRCSSGQWVTGAEGQRRLAGGPPERDMNRHIRSAEMP